MGANTICESYLAIADHSHYALEAVEQLREEIATSNAYSPHDKALISSLLVDIKGSSATDWDANATKLREVLAGDAEFHFLLASHLANRLANWGKHSLGD